MTKMNDTELFYNTMIIGLVGTFFMISSLWFVLAPSNISLFSWIVSVGVAVFFIDGIHKCSK